MKELRLRLGMAGHGGPRLADAETGGIEAWVTAGARMLWRQGLGFVPGGAVARKGTIRNTRCLERRDMDKGAILCRSRWGRTLSATDYTYLVNAAEAPELGAVSEGWVRSDVQARTMLG